MVEEDAGGGGLAGVAGVDLDSIVHVGSLWFHYILGRTALHLHRGGTEGFELSEDGFPVPLQTELSLDDGVGGGSATLHAEDLQLQGTLEGEHAVGVDVFAGDDGGAVVILDGHGVPSYGSIISQLRSFCTRSVSIS